MTKREASASDRAAALRDLLAPGLGCGPIGATVRVAVRDGHLEIAAQVEHPVAQLPVPEAPPHAAALDVAIRVEGAASREFHVAFYAKLHRQRPMLRFWGAPVADLPLDQYESSQRIVDDTHYEFHARVPLTLLGRTDGQLGCRISLAGYKGGCCIVRFATAGGGPHLPGWEGDNGFALLDDEMTIEIGAFEHLISPRVETHLKTDHDLGLDRLPPVSHTTPVTDGSERHSLDGDWRFSGSPGRPQEVAESWRTWPIIRLPGHHALQNLMIEPETDTARWVREVCVPGHWAGRRVLLRLESVEGEAHISVNGTAVAVLDSPYLPNAIDVTAALRPGEANLLQITASRRGHLNAATGRAGTSLFPDITGRVWLEALPAAWLDNLVCDTDAEGNLKLAWQGGGDAESCRLSCRLYDAEGAIAWQTDVPAAQEQCQTQIGGARPWHPEHPYLYSLELELYREGGRLARYVRRVGFRSVQVEPQRLLLNGRSIKVFGACHHPQQPHTGWWLREDEHRRDVTLFRNANVNCLRVWPLNEAFLDACDELGVMVQMEVPISFFNYTGNEFNPDDNTARKRNPAVRDANVERTIRFLLQYRNHPCVCLWSVGNESAWDDSFEASARTIKRLDANRPLLVSGVGSTGLGVADLDIDTEHYPFNRQRTFMPGTGDRPILHTEWCHIPCRNVGELTVDPGLHDRYVDALRRVVDHTRHNDIGCIGGDLFTGMEAIAYAYPPGYPAQRDHPPVLGFIDRWRRPAPEYHHVWKLFAPVEIHDVAPDRQAGKVVFHEVENRSAAGDLTDYRFTWRQGGQSGDGVLESDELHMPGPGVGDLEVSCWDAAGRLVNRWAYLAPQSPVAADRAQTLRAMADGDRLLVEQGELKWHIRLDALPTVVRANGELAVDDMARLVVTPGADDPPTGLAQGWRGTDLHLERVTEDEIVVLMNGRYAQAEGGYRLHLLADGRVIIRYRFSWLGASIRVRELGVAMRLPRNCDRLRWQRDAEWNWYPPDHIGRATGESVPFPDPRAASAGEWELPTWPWAHDATAAGCNDFRSTKRFIRRFTLLAPGGAGLAFEADGDRHARAWLDGEHVRAQCCHFTGRSAEGFCAGIDPAEMTLEKGDLIESGVTCRIR